LIRTRGERTVKRIGNVPDSCRPARRPLSKEDRMTNEERIAEWLFDESVQEAWEAHEMMVAASWQDLITNPLLAIKSYDNVRQYYRDKAKRLLTFLRDELGFVQKDEDQSYGFIWTDEAGVFIKYRCPDGFVRVKSIVEGK
jgi:hypothetical protein